MGMETPVHLRTHRAGNRFGTMQKRTVEAIQQPLSEDITNQERFKIPIQYI